MYDFIGCDNTPDLVMLILEIISKMNIVFNEECTNGIY